MKDFLIDTALCGAEIIWGYLKREVFKRDQIFTMLFFIVFLYFCEEIITFNHRRNPALSLDSLYILAVICLLFAFVAHLSPSPKKKEEEKKRQVKELERLESQRRKRAFAAFDESMNEKLTRRRGLERFFTTRSREDRERG